MITNQNFSELVKSLDKETLDAISDQSFFIEDYVLFETHIFNVGGYVTLESLPYSEDVEQEAYENGQLFCDVDTFLILIEEAI